MTEDPSVFAYDEIYDDMQAEKYANDPRIKLKVCVYSRVVCVCVFVCVRVCECVVVCFSSCMRLCALIVSRMH